MNEDIRNELLKAYDERDRRHLVLRLAELFPDDCPPPEFVPMASTGASAPH
jgi:hypothetical protein